MLAPSWNEVGTGHPAMLYRTVFHNNSFRAVNLKGTGLSSPADGPEVYMTIHTG